MTSLWRTIAALAALCIAPAAALAQAWPAKPIRIVAPFTAGGPNDIFARTVGQKLSERLGQAVVIDNRTGADGRIGAQAVAQSAPDGYTLLMLSLGHTAQASMYKLPYDLTKDFAPISQVGTIPLVLVVNTKVKAGDVKEFVQLARSTPGTMSFASSGNGTSQHLAMAMFMNMAGIKLLHVPYRGMGPAITDLIGGQVDALISPTASVAGHIKSGQLRALGVTTSEPYPLLPGVPTIAQSGYAGYQVDTWHGLVAPAGTPAAVVQLLSRQVQEIMQLPDVKEKFAQMGATAAPNTPAEFAQQIEREIAKWHKVVQEAGIVGD